MNEFSIAKLLGPVRHVSGHDVCMNVNLQIDPLADEVIGKELITIR